MSFCASKWTMKQNVLFAPASFSLVPSALSSAFSLSHFFPSSCFLFPLFLFPLTFEISDYSLGIHRWKDNVSVFLELVIQWESANQASINQCDKWLNSTRKSWRRESEECSHVRVTQSEARVLWKKGVNLLRIWGERGFEKRGHHM